MKNFSEVDTPKPESSWNDLDDDARLRLVNTVTSRFDAYIVLKPTRATNEGFVFVQFVGQVSSKVRGGFLLDYELLLKDNIDQSLTVWLDPIGDKNSLRNLRGILIKSV